MRIVILRPWLTKIFWKSVTWILCFKHHFRVFQRGGNLDPEAEFVKLISLRERAHQSWRPHLLKKKASEGRYSTYPFKDPCRNGVTTFSHFLKVDFTKKGECSTKNKISRTVINFIEFPCRFEEISTSHIYISKESSRN